MASRAAPVPKEAPAGGRRVLTGVRRRDIGADTDEHEKGDFWPAIAPIAQATVSLFCGRRFRPAGEQRAADK